MSFIRSGSGLSAQHRSSNAHLRARAYADRHYDAEMPFLRPLILSAEVLLGNPLMAWCSSYPLVPACAAGRVVGGPLWLQAFMYSAAVDGGRQHGSIKHHCQ
jgi:hypothetical protein